MRWLVSLSALLIIGVAVFSTRPRPAVSASAPFEQSSAQLPQGGAGLIPVRFIISFNFD